MGHQCEIQFGWNADHYRRGWAEHRRSQERYDLGRACATVVKQALKYREAFVFWRDWEAVVVTMVPYAPLARSLFFLSLRMSRDVPVA